MKSHRQHQNLLAALTVTALAFSAPALQATVTLNNFDVFITDGKPTGNLIISGTTAMSGGTAAGVYSTAMSYGWAGGLRSTAMSGGGAQGDGSTAMSVGYASGKHSTAMSYGWADGYRSTAMSGGHALGDYSTAMTAGAASGDYSLAAGRFVESYSYSSVSFGAYNTTWGTPDSWVETDPLLLLGNGDGASTSNAITTLKNGQTTLTNKAWMANANVAPTTANSNGEALVVEGHSVLKGNLNVGGTLAVGGQPLSTWLSSTGFVKQTDVDAKGYQTAAQVAAFGYQTAAMVNSAITSKGFLTSATATAGGFLKQPDVDAKGYQTAANVSAELASRNLVTVSNLGATLANTPQVELRNTTIQGDAVLNGKVTIEQAQGDISMGIYQ